MRRFDTISNIGQCFAMVTPIAQQKPLPADWIRAVQDARLPVLVSVPHACRDYSDALLANLRVPVRLLTRLEDRFADLLVRGAADAGCAVLTASSPRAWIDLNRRPDEIDPDMVIDAPRSAFAQPSAKVRGGLGLIPRRLGDAGTLWRRGLTSADIASRIARDHDPYHRAIAYGLNALRERFGAALLLDVHSMPPLVSAAEPKAAQIVIGDRFGVSASSQLSDCAIFAMRREGYRVALNHPYAGGYVLQRHGAPDTGIHAIQLEVDRALYLDAALYEPAAGVVRLNGQIRQLVETLSEVVIRPDLAIAAE